MSENETASQQRFWTLSTILVTLILLIIVIAIFAFAFTQNLIWVTSLGLLYAFLLIIPVVLRMQRRTHFMGYFMHIITLILAIAIIALFWRLQITFGPHPLLWDYYLLALSLLFCSLLVNFIVYKYMRLIALPTPKSLEL
ncbi:MAG: hypothetical protein ACFFCW_34615 [Candidatus Hodarchaeota archaeon]